MSDREFLMWIHERLEHYGDNYLMDFMHKLRAIIAETPVDKVTKSIGQGGNNLNELREKLKESK